MDKLKEIFVIIFSLVVGLFLIYFAYSMFTNYPSKSALIWLPNSEVSEVKYSASKDSLKRMCLFSKEGLCLSINSDEEGFAQLLAATKNGVNYSIGYYKEHAILSDDPTLYNMIYEIQIGGKVVRSYDERIRGLKNLCGGVGLLGVLLIGFALYKLRQIMHQQGSARTIYPDLIDNTSSVGYTSRSEVNIPMSQSEVWKILKVFPIIVAVLFIVTFVYWLGAQFGISRWLTGVVSLTLLFLCVILFSFRQFDQVRKRGSLLMAAAFTALTAASLVNEYVNHFFTPSYFYLFLAIAPLFIFSAYHAYLEWRELNSTSTTSVPEGAAKNDKWFRVYRGVVQQVNFEDEDSANIPGLKFKLNGLSVHVPNQPNKHIVIKENDNIEFCGRPSFYLKNSAVCLAYRINGHKTINAVNEWWHLSAAVILFIAIVVALFTMGFGWPLIIIVPVSIYFAVSSYWSFNAKSILANEKL